MTTTVNLAPGPFGAGGQFFNANGQVLNGGQIYTYQAGTTTPYVTYTTSAGNVANQNPIILTSSGYLPNEVWLVAGIAYKFVLEDSLNNIISTSDNLVGINDFSSLPVNSEWTPIGLTPTYVSATSFTLAGNQTAIFTTNRRLQFTQTGATIYGVVTSSSVTSSITTVNVTVDSGGSLTSGLSAVSYGILNAANPSVPQIMTQGSGLQIVYNAGVPTFNGGNGINNFRLTLTSGTPVTTGNVTGATTLYCSPYTGNYITLYDGSANWVLLSSAEFSIALGTLTNGLLYDAFCYNNAGTPALEFAAWTNSTTRATALVLQNGILCKSGALTRRYMGTFFTTSATTTEDSASNRYLWNYYNRIRKPMQAIDATTTWNYSTATWRQANANTSDQLNFVIGVSEDEIIANVRSNCSSTALGQVAVGVGVDSTTVNSAIVWGGLVTGNTGEYNDIDAQYRGYPGVGKHYLAWLEISNVGGGTQTWGGTQTTGVSGILGDIPV